jgi:hypothetical protein
MNGAPPAAIIQEIVSQVRAFSAGGRYDAAGVEVQGLRR